MATAGDLGTWLSGRWSVDRRLQDRRLGEHGTFEGLASFEPEGDGLRWTEEGRLRLGRHDGPASRVLALRPAGRGWEVRFDDGRLFHALDLTAGACGAEHPCAPDHYSGVYRVLDADALEVVWEVRGPRKDLMIHTVYRRLAPGDVEVAGARVG